MSLDDIPERFRQRIQEAKEQQLEELDLSNEWGADDSQRLTRIPDEVFELTYLKKLDLTNNQLNNLPKSISNLSNLTRLYLSKNQLNNLPVSIGNLSNLTKLDLSANQLTNLPESIGNLYNLTELYLSENRLNKLPKSIGNLSNLIDLDLSRNKLYKLPESIGNLSNLTDLDLSVNKLNELPESIGNLSNLTRLNLNYNQLNKLSESIGSLYNLTRLSLNNNGLNKLSESIGNLYNLTRLSLIGNRLSKLPESIGNLSDLTELDLSGNPLESPPIEIANRSIKEIREYFRQLKEEGKDYIYEAKLLIVGEAGAGKTTLAKKIEDPNYKLDSNEKSTEGIDITKWSFPYNEREFKVNIWDFGGQEIYHATHQFFLTKRSLYALVVDNRKEDDNLYYWLNVVELLSDSSPLLIIKNEKQNRQREINERALRGQFDNLEKTLPTNLATNDGLDDVLKNIKHYISTLEHIGSPLPKTWVKVRQALEKDERNYISLNEYLNLCQNNGFTQLKDKLQLSAYLHDLGVCLHFQDDEYSLLYRTVILKPEWGTDAVYKVLDNIQVLNHQGYFTRDDLKTIWHKEKYFSMRGELLELMKKFQLCYEIPSKKDTFIAPQLLSDNQLDYEWDKTNNLILRYAYPDFMPKGIISRFIVIMHQYIHSTNHHQCVWKSIVILEQDNTLAEVIEYYGKREIRIRVVGNNKRNFMTIITHELDKINNSYNRLKYQKLIPCNCSVCKNNQNPHSYDFNKLQEWRINGRQTTQCDNKPYDTVNILSLIDDAIDLNHFIKTETIEGEREKEYLRRIVELQATRPIQTIVNNKNQLDNTNMTGDHNINQHGKGDNIAGDKVMGDKSINQSRNVNISGNAQVTASGAGAFNQGNNNGRIANNINQDNPHPQQPKESKLTKILGIGAAVATVIALFFNGIFNTEVRQWFDNLFDKDIPSTSQPKEP